MTKRTRIMIKKSHSRSVTRFRETMRSAQRSSTTLVQTTVNALKAATSEPGSRLVTDHERTMLNAFLYFALHGQDMAFLADDFGATRAHIRKRVYARVLALQCVELFDDFPEVIKGMIQSAEGPALRDAAAKLSPIRRKYESLLRCIRNTAIGHRNLDAIKQLESMTDIDVHQFFRLLSEVFEWRTELTQAFIPVLKRMSDRLSAVAARQSGA